MVIGPFLLLTPAQQEEGGKCSEQKHIEIAWDLTWAKNRQKNGRASRRDHPKEEKERKKTETTQAQ